MKADLIRIGNSRGLRIPKPLIEQVGLGDTVELQVENNRIVIFSQRRPREGWAEAFSVTDSNAQAILLDHLGENSFDRKDWKW
jgi:antitoxin MazE